MRFPWRVRSAVSERPTDHAAELLAIARGDLVILQMVVESVLILVGPVQRRAGSVLGSVSGRLGTADVQGGATTVTGLAMDKDSW